MVAPSTAEDAYGLLRSAIDDPDPVMVFEHKLLYKMKGDVPQHAYRVPIGKAAVRREGRHVTLVATAIMVHRALEAAQTLGISPASGMWRVALPMARPWIATGLALVCMESLADFGAVSVFNYDTFTTAI